MKDCILPADVGFRSEIQQNYGKNKSIQASYYIYKSIINILYQQLISENSGYPNNYNDSIHINASNEGIR